MEDEGSGHESAARLGDLPAAGSRKLGDEPASVESLEQSGDASRGSSRELSRIVPVEELLADMDIAETVEAMLPA